jgi:DNA-binding transcriptional LysR family regulator
MCPKPRSVARSRHWKNALARKLLERSTRGVTLTDIGRTFANECTRLLRAADEADASANGLHVEPRGMLTLVAPLNVRRAVADAAGARLPERLAGIEVSVAYQDRFPNLHEEGVDVAVLIGSAARCLHGGAQVGMVRQLICASPDYLATPSAAPQHAGRIWPRMRWCSAAPTAACWSGALSIKARRATSRSSRVALHHAARPPSMPPSCGAGLACCLSYQVHEHLQAGRLQPVLKAFEPDCRAGASGVPRRPPGIGAGAQFRRLRCGTLRLHPVLHPADTPSGADPCEVNHFIG